MDENKIIENSLEAMKASENYWRELLVCESKSVQLKGDFEYEGQNEKRDFTFLVDRELSLKLKKVSNGNSLSMYTILIAALEVYFEKSTLQEELIIGIPVYYKSKNKYLPNKIIPFKNIVEENKSFKEVLITTKNNLLDSYKNQIYSLKNIIAEEQILELASISICMANLNEEEDYRCLIESNENKICFIINNSEELTIKTIYNSKLFEENTIKKMCEIMQLILRQAINNIEIKLENIKLVDEEEENLILRKFNDTKDEYDNNTTIHEFFEKQVELTPENRAVTINNESITYRELNNRANELAIELRENGVGANSIVGVMIERSLELIVGIIAILKAGGCYMPIDPEYPEERINYIIENSGAKNVIVGEKLKDKISGDIRLISIDIKKKIDEIPNLKSLSTHEDLVYLIYTSGTTGKPKGVMFRHKGLVNLINFEDNRTNINLRTKVLQFATISFDVATQEIMSTLLSGGELILIDSDKRKDINQLVEFIEDNKIKTIFLPTAFFKLIASEDRYIRRLLNSVKDIIVAGEQLILEKEVIKLINEKGIRVHNHYGPTETHVVTTTVIDKNSKTVPYIGKPISNTSIYILDKNKNVVPVKMIGELYIAGANLARGYINNEQLTKEKFIDNPFKPGEKMYKTGDLARWMEDGNIEYLGRIDHQVKIRGFRVELGEIESNLLKIPGIKSAVVLDKESNGSKFLCAYYVDDRYYKISELKDILSENLPDYMIPAHFIKMDALPLTTNGKVDRRALPEPSRDISRDAEYIEPRSKIEKQLASIWSQILEVNRIGIDDNFFELGGHSLKATILVGRIHKEMNLEIPLKEILERGSIREVSKYLEKAEKKEFVEINKIKEAKYYEASSAEKRMYLIQEVSKKSTAYNLPGVIEIKGKLNLKKLKDTLNTIIQRHEILRTNFESIDGEIYQIVKKMDEINFDIQNFQVEDRNNIGDVLKEFIRPFDLEKDVLIRIGIGSLGREHNLMFFDIHHIVADGVTLGIFIKEFSEIYEGKALEPLKIQYKDYSAWQIKRRGNEEVMDSKRYWLKEFDEEIPVLNLPTDFNRPNIQDFKGDVLEFKLDEKKTNALKDIAMETNSTLYMVLLSILKTLLSKYSNQEDIVVGSPIAGRNHRDLENLIGMFVNTFAIKSTVDRNMSFKKYLEVIREKTLKAYENQEYQFEDLIEALNIERNLSRNPLFDVMFVLQNIDTLEINIEGLKFEQLNIENGIEKFDITMEAVERNNEILFRVSYASSLFKKETIQRMNDSYITIVNSIIHDINVKISDINIVSDIEKNKLLYEFNDSKTDYPKEKSINELFEEQVELTPDNIAVTFEDSKLTYKELNEKSNKVAACLREKGVKHGTIVGIMVNRSLEMIIGIIGILKAGGGYLPIDPETPKDRVKYMLEDSKANILLVQGNLIEEAQFNINIVNLNEKNIDKYEGVNLIRENNSSDVAYIIYTSGSTGMPKGVIINHYSAVRVVKNTNYIEISKDDRILQLSNYAFDGSIFDIYGALLNGATLVMMSKETLLDINELANLIKKKKVTITFITTALFNTIVDMKIECLANLKKILFGGERASVGHVKRALDYLGKGRIIHVYGPTESTVYATYYNVNEINKEDKTIPIGKPLANTSLLVVDDNGDIVPIGVEGELCIFGDGLSRGYLNNKELTEKKFTSSKYIKDERIYHTGDLVKWLPSGEVEFIGRMDNQVKIRGHRIELGEIESKLLEIDGIKSVVVVDKVKNDSKYICAYYVSQNEYTVSELRNILLRTLPEYMIPTYFVKLEKFILTRNGKVDKKSLPEPSGDIYTGKQYVAPRNELEKKLVQIWSEILEVKNIGIDDNFFELGGHSLKATVLVAKINKELDIAIPLREIFDRGNIRKISEFINETGENKYEKISLVEEKDYYKVSSAEKRMYLVQQFDKESIAYNAPAMMEIDGDLDCDKLKKTVTLIIERHEILRTNFRTINGEIIQIVNNMSDINLNIETIEMKDRSNLNNFINDFIKPFNLEKDLLIRVSLIKLAEKKHIMFVDMHHIVSDGSTMKIFIKEFNDIYLGKNLEPLRIQYKDYAYWQINRIESEDIKKQKNYWLSEFKGNIPVLNLPTDFSRPTMQDYKGDVIKFKLGEEETRFLKNIARKTNSTLYMVLLANINILLAKYSNQQDIVVGSPIAGRNHADLNNIMGMFVNTLAIRSTINADMTFEDYLKVVREKTLKAYENQEYQFEDLVEALNIQRDLSRNPLFDVMFVLQNVEIGEFNIDGLEFKQLFIDNDTEKFDITIQAMESCDEVEFSISYATKLFTKETIERMRDHLLTIIRAIGRNHELKIKNIDITSNLEKKFILEGYNGTDVAFTNNKTLITLFEEQVKKTPENIAVVCGENKISYRKLNEKANVLARMLIDNGIEKGEKVCILLDRSIELVVGILAILKTGSAYIPMDKSYPKNRIKAIVESCNSKVVLTDENFEKDSYGKIKMMNINDENQGNESRDNLGIITDTKDIAYVIFTSGSTGNPKGVVVTNAQCINTIIDINRKFNINDKDAILCISSICFDLSVYDIFGALISGAKVVVVRNSKDINEIIYELNSEKITVWNSVPAFMELLVDQMPTEKKNSSLRVVLLSGDWIGLELPNKIKYHFPEACTISLGGATEGAIWSIYYPINEVKKEWKSIPYGYPLANQKMFILDRNLSIQPIEIPGEICIGGAGVVEGYLNDEIKTRNSFILHPTLGKIYKTGDLGVMNKAGYIEFLGRLDYQVKIRGFRIELGEIESNLRKIEGMKTVIVVDKEGEEGKYLCAYYLGDKEYTVSELREKLLADLPEYMIPSYFIKLDKLPLTSNGKIDRKSLPEPDGKIKTGRKYVEARNDLEKRLTKIWSEVLGVNHIGIDDNFFELGGHSLKATILLGRIYKEFHVEVGLKVIFERSTIREISEYIKGKDESKIEEIPKIEKKEYYEVSSAEKRIYLVQQTNQRSVAYNLPTILEVDGDLDIDRLKKTVEQIVERHEVLRSNYLLLDGKVIKKIKKLEEVDLKIQHMNNINKENLIETFNEFIKPFDLEKDVLIRISVGKLDSLKSIIFFDMHHIVSDGSSVAVFIKEFSEIYSGKVLSPLRVQYKDYAVWQNSKKESSKLADERMYWLKEFEESIPVLNLPTDFPRPQIKDYSGNFIEFKLDKELTLALKKVLKSTNSTMYMALLASIKILLSKYSGQDEIVVGSPIAGRVHKDIENLMGVFINNIAIKSKIRGNQTFKDYLEQIKEKTLKAYENQYYQFDDLVDSLNIESSLNRNPLFDVMFMWQNMDKQEFKIEGLKFKECFVGNHSEKFDITFEAAEKDDEIIFTISYATSLFKEDTIHWMKEHLIKVIEQVSSNMVIKLSDINIGFNFSKMKDIEFEEEFTF